MSTVLNNNIDKLCIDNIRVLCSEMIDKAKSGHPGMAIGAAPILHTLYTRFLNATPSQPEWFNRDYFVLSGGHASSLLYSVLHLSGYEISMEDLKAFRSLGSITPGHPEFHNRDRTGGEGYLNRGLQAQRHALHTGRRLAEVPRGHRELAGLNQYGVLEWRSKSSGCSTASQTPPTWPYSSHSCGA